MAIGRPIELTPNITSKNISVASTEGQTEFTVTGGYRINEIAVYRNGVRLVDGRDFSATDGTTVTLISDSVVADDVVEFSVFDSFDVAGVIVGAASSQAVNGNLHVTGEFYAGTFVPNNIVATAGTFNNTLHVGSAITVSSSGDVETIGIATATGVDVTSNLTVGSGVTIGSAGVATFSGTSDVHLLDNVKLLVGDSSDLEIYHQGYNSKIADVGTGALILSGSVVKIENGASSETQAVFTEDGAVELYYNDTKKWETTNDGTVTTGIATATGVDVTSNLTVGSGITIGSAGIVTAIGLDAAISVWTLGADGTSHYTFTGPGNLSATNDPTLNLIRGQKYVFKNGNGAGAHPFRIQSTINGSAGTAYNTGVTNNDGAGGTDIIFDVPYDAPAVLYYQCTAHANMGGVMYISGSGYEVKVGAAITIGTAGIATVGVNTSQGIVLTSANGTKYRLFVENDGSLKTAAN